MQNLRELKVEKIRKYHQEFYRPDNLCIIITGKLDIQRLLEILKQYETKISLPIKNTKPWGIRTLNFSGFSSSNTVHRFETNYGGFS